MSVYIIISVLTFIFGCVLGVIFSQQIKTKISKTKLSLIDKLNGNKTVGKDFILQSIVERVFLDQFEGQGLLYKVKVFFKLREFRKKFNPLDYGAIAINDEKLPTFEDILMGAAKEWDEADEEGRSEILAKLEENRKAARKPCEDIEFINGRLKPEKSSFSRELL